MIRTIIMMVAIALTAPLHAQDYTGNVNPSAHSGPMVMESAIDAQARRNYQRSNSGATSGQIAACRKKAQFRAQHGASNPKVQRLYRLCREIGV